MSRSGFASVLVFPLLILPVLLTAPCFALITGTVTDTIGSPVDGALVTLTDESNPDNYYSDYTDSDGKYELPISQVLVKEEVPAGFRLYQNYPNPFNPATTIPYSLESPGHVNLVIYNIMGQKIRTVVDSYQSFGVHTVTWDGLDDFGKSVAAGIYIYQLKTGNQVQSRKMLLLDGGGITEGIRSTPAVAKISRKSSTNLYTVTVVKGGYFDYEKTNVNINTITTLDITLNPYETTYETETTDDKGRVEITGYEGGAITVNFKGIAEKPIEGIDVYSISNVYGTTIICTDPTGEYFGTIQHFPSSITASKPAPVIVWDFEEKEGEFVLTPAGEHTKGVDVQKVEGVEAERIWRDLQELPQKEPAWKEFLQGSWNLYDGWESLKIVFTVIKTGTLAHPGGLLISTFAGEAIDELTQSEYDKYMARVHQADNIAILMNDGTILPEGKIIGRITSYEENIGIPDVEVSISAGPATDIDPVKTLWNGYYVITNLPPGRYTLNAQITSTMTIFIYLQEYLYGHEGQDLTIGNVYVSDYENESITVDIEAGQTSSGDMSLNYSWITGLSLVLRYRKAGETVFNETVMDVTNFIYQGTIPGDAVTSAGVEYQIVATYGRETIETTVYTIPVFKPSTHEIHGITFVSIPAVTTPYEMASGYTVTLSAYEMSANEVTNAQYAEYLNSALVSGDITATSSSVEGRMGNWNGRRYIYLAGYDRSYPDNNCKIVYSNGSFSVKSGYENWPVVYVSWYGSKAFAEYYGLDLPTEAEWQYAASGGRNYEYGTADGTISTGTVNYRDTGIKHPVAVGSYPANPFGLYDLSGNVWEWCIDWFNYYPSGSVNNPTGAQLSSTRVIRGGSWYDFASNCWTINRYFSTPYNSYRYLGFRVVSR